MEARKRKYIDRILIKLNDTFTGFDEGVNEVFGEIIESSLIEYEPTFQQEGRITYLYQQFPHDHVQKTFGKLVADKINDYICTEICWYIAPNRINYANTNSDHIKYIFQLLNQLYKYQQLHNIKEQCVSNCQYLYDCIRANYADIIPVRVVPAIWCKSGDSISIVIHLIVIVNGTVFDPSYETAHVPEGVYFKTIIDFKNHFLVKGKKFPSKIMRKIIQKFLSMTEIAAQINNGEFCVDNEYYHKQADYVEENFLISN